MIVRRSLVILLVLLAFLALFPSGEAQQPRAVPRATVTAPPEPVEPGTTIRLEMLTTVTFPQGSYCFDPLRLEFSRTYMPAHASLVIEPAKIVFEFSQDNRPVAATGPHQLHFSTALHLTPGPQASAYMHDNYEIAVNLIAPTSPTCWVASQQTKAHFLVKNGYRPDTHVEPQGWSQADPSVFEVLVTNNGNGPTRVHLEEIDVDPIAIGRMFAQHLSLGLGETGVFAIEVPDRAEGNYTAVVGLRSSYDGPQEGATDLDEVTIFVEHDPMAAEALPSGTVPNLGALGTLVSLVGMLFWHRRTHGR